MIKTHSVTGMKYLCSTTVSGKRYDKYKGSGRYWKNYMRKHGFDIRTELIFESDDLELFKKIALEKSAEFDVVNSEEWANLEPEAGPLGGFYGSHTEETKAKIALSRIGTKWSEERKLKLIKSKTGMKYNMSEEGRRNIRATGAQNVGRKHTEETKIKIRQTAILREQKKREARNG